MQTLFKVLQQFIMSIHFLSPTKMALLKQFGTLAMSDKYSIQSHWRCLNISVIPLQTVTENFQKIQIKVHCALPAAIGPPIPKYKKSLYKRTNFFHLVLTKYIK